MPNHIGAFLKASECFASLGVNITRVSYNKALDSHTLFIDAEGTPDQLDKADAMLADIGYIRQTLPGENVMLLEFRLNDVPGSVTEVLCLISEYSFNISYISSQENGTGYQDFKMGLFVEDAEKLNDFIKRAGELCRVRVIEYNHAEKFYDNSIFYNSFVSGIMCTAGLPEEYRDELMINTNLVMQTLDEKGTSPYKTFDSINRFSELLAACRGEAFSPRITRHKVTENTSIILIEPACGSNTIIIESGGEYLFIDCGYALYKDEMTALFREILPDFDNMRKKIFVTHADVDHCGLLPMFDEIIASRETKECFELEYAGKNGYREQNPLHKPYVSICKTLTRYMPPDPEKITVINSAECECNEPITFIGEYDFDELHFSVYEGKGGHLKGETVLIDDGHKIVFTGDIYINTHGLTKEQAEYNQYAPVLMNSVDTDKALCALERKAITERLGKGRWQIFGAHGMKIEYEI